MAAETKITPARLTRLTGLLEAGESVRAIASSLGVDERTVRRWMKERSLESTRSSGAPRKSTLAKPTTAAAKSGPAAVTPQQLAAEVTRAEAALGQYGAARESREFLCRELAYIEVQLSQARETMVRGESSSASFERLSKLRRDYLQELRALDEAALEKPGVDTLTQEAADRTLAKFQKLVLRFEAEARDGAGS